MKGLPPLVGGIGLSEMASVEESGTAEGSGGTGTGCEVVTTAPIAAVCSGFGALSLPMNPKFAQLNGSALPPGLVPSASFLHFRATSPRAVKQSSWLNLTWPCWHLSSSCAMLDQNSIHTPA